MLVSLRGYLLRDIIPFGLDICFADMNSESIKEEYQ